MSRDERNSAPGRERSRRDLLRTTGAALAAAVATAGCLSNPWGPERRGSGDEPGGAGTTRATSTPGSTTAGTDATESPQTTAGTEPTATEPAAPTTTSVPAEEREPDLIVDVAADGFSFAPETFTVAAGDTVHWVWRSSGHNVRVREKPDDSDWTGTPGTASDTYGEGYLHAHTFQASGRYEYYCAPHQTLGLEGSFEVE